MKWKEIPQLTRTGNYETNVPLDFLESHIQKLVTRGLQLIPDFQRGHVWKSEQQSKYLEYFLSGGQSGMVIYFNRPSWQTEATTEYDDFVCVDGLQRLTALRLFVANKVKAFGQFNSDFGGDINMSRNADNLRININNLQTKIHVLQWYIQMNSGGTPHTEGEINKVKLILDKETKI